MFHSSKNQYGDRRIIRGILGPQRGMVWKVCYNLILPYSDMAIQTFCFFIPLKIFSELPSLSVVFFYHITIFIWILALGNNEVSLKNDNKKDCYKVFRVNAIWWPVGVVLDWMNAISRNILALMKIKKCKIFFVKLREFLHVFLPSVVQSHFSSRFLCPVQIFFWRIFSANAALEA